MPNGSAPSVVGDGSSKTTIVAETVTGSHVLEVKGYSAAKGQLGVGKRIDSGVFSVGGHRWILQYYPDGFNEESANHISIFVQIKNLAAMDEVKARYGFSLLDHAGEPLSRYTFTSDELGTFSSTNVSWGFRTFIERKELESSYLRDDSFQIKCDLTVVKDVRKENLLAFSMPNCSAPSVVGDGSSKTTIVAETVTGSHVLEVKGYSAAKGQLGVGKRIDSDVFSVGGHRWSLQYFPDGFNEESANHVSIFVQIKNPVAKDQVKARYRFSLLDHAGEPVSSYDFTSEFIRTFSATNVSWGFRTFIERKKLESSYLRDDSFQIKCDLTVFKDLVCKETTIAAAAKPDLQRHFGNLLASKVGGDVVFKVDGELIIAHQCVLAARSSVFMAELFGPTQTKATGHIRVVQDMEAWVFRCMLHFIYTDSLPEIDTAQKAVMARHLLVAAERYDLQSLKLICEDKLRSSVDISIAATTLVLAEQHACQRLKVACFEFLKAPGNLKAVMATDGFQHLKSSCPSLLEELLAQVAP